MRAEALAACDPNTDSSACDAVWQQKKARALAWGG
jgi:hypothetical protein